MTFQNLIVNPRTLQAGGKNFTLMMSKFKDILKEISDRNLPGEGMNEENDEITKEQQITIRKNEIAMESFSMP
jgi:hypothetical protein